MIKTIQNFNKISIIEKQKVQHKQPQVLTGNIKNRESRKQENINLFQYIIKTDELLKICETISLQISYKFRI
jgi:hypothetical protein